MRPCEGALGDEAELFREVNRQFVRTVQSPTNAPREIVDDACGFIGTTTPPIRSTP